MRTPATIIAATALALTTAAQGPMQLSMKQAMDLAAQQSYQVQYGSLEARKAAARLGVQPEVLLAQAAHETGWGRHVPQRPPAHPSDRTRPPGR